MRNFLTRLAARRVFGIRPGLETMQQLCAALGHPEREFAVIHIAGTNGKGSVAAICEAALRTMGLPVARYTSPHLVHVNERFLIHGEPVSDDALARALDTVEAVCTETGLEPTFFEVLTACAWVLFREAGCKIVVCETGMGGRWDATNVIEEPLVTVITRVALDHCTILGDTVEAIAAEKAGIIKEGVPCLWCGNSEAAYNVMKNHAKEKKAPLYTVKRESLNVKKSTLDGTIFDFDDFCNVKITLLGEYQLINACNALTAVKILGEAGIQISEESVYSGMEAAKWPARFEILSKEPLVIFDGAHNPEGVSSCVESIKKYFASDRVIAVTGVMADKDYRYIADRIGEVAACVMCLTPNNPRALSSKEYAKEFLRQGVEAHSFDTVEEAVCSALKIAKEKGMATACLGSLYMYSEVENALESAMKK